MGSQFEVVRAKVTATYKRVDVMPTGFLLQEPGRIEIVGKRAIRVVLSEAHFLLSDSVVAYFGFDERDQLIAIWVWTTRDGL